MEKELSSKIIYPDPFKPCGIEFELPENARVTLKIFDFSGEEVATLIDDREFRAGIHRVELNSTECMSGAYFYRLSAQSNGKDFTDTKKLILVK